MDVLVFVLSVIETKHAILFVAGCDQLADRLVIFVAILCIVAILSLAYVVISFERYFIIHYVCFVFVPIQWKAPLKQHQQQQQNTCNVMQRRIT